MPRRICLLHRLSVKELNFKIHNLLPGSSASTPSAARAILPVATLLAGIAAIVIFCGADAVSVFAPYALLGASAVAVGVAIWSGSLSRRGLAAGRRRSASQVLPAVPMLFLIAMLATTWMMSGVVPALIDYGLCLLNPRWFLVTTCATCAVVSVLTGSSWSTIATIGVAFMGIGEAMGYGVGWVAGAIISGAYFGDKISPLSDTTVVASSTCGVDLLDHIRYLMITSVPAMLVALVVFGMRGLAASDAMPPGHTAEMIAGLETQFTITPYTLIIPAITGLLIILRVPTLITLAAGALLGGIGIFVFQPAIVTGAGAVIANLWSGFEASTGSASVDSLTSTGGILGMLPTIGLVLSAMVFGWLMIGTGMLDALGHAITSRLRRRTSIVGATVASGLAANSCTSDQYLSLIITGNMYRTVFRRARLEPRLLSRSIEDAVSVTSVLIPWNSCGLTQSTVLGVATLTYLPYCVFNYLSPLMSIAIAYTGFKIADAGRVVSRTRRAVS